MAKLQERTVAVMTRAPGGGTRLVKEEATAITCPGCAGTAFTILLIGPERHTHLLCVRCAAVYCQHEGPCDPLRN